MDRSNLLMDFGPKSREVPYRLSTLCFILQHGKVQVGCYDSEITTEKQRYSLTESITGSIINGSMTESVTESVITGSVTESISESALLSLQINPLLCLSLLGL